MTINDDVSKKMTRVQEELEQLDHREQEFRDELQEIAEEWRGYLDEKELDLEEKLERAEAPLQFATTGSAFEAEGWVPADRFDDVKEALEAATDDRVHIERAEDNNPHEAPVKHDNPDGVNNFESLVGFFGVPSYTEVDPTFLLVTFPLLFGFMLGDVGYGITTFAVFYFMYRKFPEAEGLWKSLMYASVATIAFGLVYAEAFGYIIFGHESVLAALTGLHLFSDIPILYHRGHHLTEVMTMALWIGAFHVGFGNLVGAYNEYLDHGVMEAIFAKVSWIVLEIGGILLFLQGSTIQGAIGPISWSFAIPEMAAMYGGMMAAGFVMLAKGEGIEGVVEIPSLLSNILSYLRILGVVIAILALAQVVNVIAGQLFQSGNIVMMLFGVLILIIGHALNTFIKMIEAGLQGIRLHYVEFFTKFFEGGGEYYRPFGTQHFKKS